MDVLWSLLLGLPGVFVAAFLAMMLENIRERNRTRKWVLRNLRAMVTSIQTNPAETWDAVETAVQRWLDAESPDDMDNDSWRRSYLLTTGFGPDFTPILRSEAAISVPGELFAALYELEDRAMAVQVVTSMLNDCFTRDVLPLWYERRVPLGDADARRVSSYLVLIDASRSAIASLRGAIAQFQEQVRLALPDE